LVGILNVSGSKKLLKIKNKIIYTVCTGKYKNILLQAPHYNNWETVAFTDDLNMESKGWTLKPILYDNVENLNNRKLSRHPKMNPHLYLKDYNVSLYIDSKLQLLKNPDYLLNYLENYKWITLKHPERTRFFQEIFTCLYQKKITLDDAMKIMDRYRENHYVEQNNLSENSLILRYHNDSENISVGEMWWNEYISLKNERDQLIFPLVLFRINCNIVLLNNEELKISHVKR
jgi:hypothetical protein